MYSNDGLNLRAVAMGDALAHGQAVIKANKRMEWGMAMGQHQPRILWARIAQVHEDAEVGQVAVRFDTNQVSLSQLLTCGTTKLTDRSSGRQRMVKHIRGPREFWRITYLNE